MSRRQGAEGFTSNKKARKQAKSTQRAQDTQSERETLVIACEDSVSAPLYFNAIFDDLKRNHAIAASSLVIAKHKHTDPDGVLDDLLDHLNYQDFDHQWIVIDRDEERTNGGGHTLESFNQAIARANDKKIKVAYSNPCLEIWYLLHFEFRNTAIDRDELVKQLEHQYQYKKNELFILNQDQQRIAIKNASNLIQSWVDTQGSTKPATDNPSTTVHDLVTLLNGFKKDPTHQSE
ncbi:MAG: RloB family protein [Gammaproteobacteria bacterium]